MYSPFDINEAVAQRRDYVEEGLRTGSPVVGLRYENGLLLLSVRRQQRKIYEIYDRQMFSAIGRQSDVENLRLAAIQTAHQEGFERSPSDVTLHRLVGFSLSPTIKRAFGDPMYVPVVIRALFAELGRTEEHDSFVTLNYDGEYRTRPDRAGIAGTFAAEEKMVERLEEGALTLKREEALRLALSAWAIGMREALKTTGSSRERDNEDDLPNPLRMIDDADSEQALLREELKSGTVEAAVLERRTQRESRFRLVPASEIETLTRDYR